MLSSQRHIAGQVLILIVHSPLLFKYDLALVELIDLFLEILSSLCVIFAINLLSHLSVAENFRASSLCKIFLLKIRGCFFINKRLSSEADIVSLRRA